MSQVTITDGYRALIVPDERLTPDTFVVEGVAVMTEAGSRAGIALPSQSGTEAVVATHSGQDDTTYTIRCLRGGYAGEGEYGWTATADGVTTSLIGCNYPNLVQDVRHIGGGVTTGTTTGAAAAVRTSSGRVVWLYCRRDAVTGLREVFSSYTDDHITITGADNSIKLLSENDGDDLFLGYTFDNSDCVAACWEDERQVVQAWIRVEDPTNSKTQFVLFESEDEGATWSLVQRNCLVFGYSTSDTLRRPIVLRVNGATLLLQPEDDATSSYTLSQYVSNDRGRSFALLSSDATDHKGFTAVAFNNRVQIAAINWSTDDIELTSLASAYDVAILGSWETLTTPQNVSAIGMCVQYGMMHLFVATSGTVHVLSSLSDTVNTTMLVSEVWRYVGSGALSFGGSGSNVDILDLAPAPALGGVFLAFSLSGTGVSAALRNHSYSMRMGGWSTIVLPSVSRLLGDGPSRVSFGTVNLATTGTYYSADRATYLPFLAPDAITGAVWTASGTGTDAAGLSAGDSPYRSVSCDAGESRYWTQTFTGDLSKGVLLLIDMEVTAGGSSTGDQSGVQVSLSDGSATEYRFFIRITATGIYLHDDVGGTTSSVIELTGGERRVLIVAARETGTGEGAVTLYRGKYDDLGSVREMEQLHDGTTYIFTLDPDGTPSASSYVSFGVVGAAAATTEQKWYSVQFIAACDLPGVYSLVSQTYINNSDMVGGAPCSSLPVEVDGGLLVSFSGGASKRGETWSIAPRYDYAKEHVYPHLYPSPRQKWRSAYDAVTHTFQWLFDASDEAPQGMGSADWGIALIGINFSDWELQGQDAAGAWQDIINGDTTAEFTDLPYRAGIRSTFTSAYVTVDMDGTGFASRYIHENELAGGHVKVGSQYFKILRNTSGYWNPVAGRKPVLYLETWDSSIAETGVLSILPPSVVAIAHGLGSTEYRRLRLSITAQTTAEGYYEIGSMVIGPAYLFGRQYSHGRTMTRQSNVSLRDTMGGATSVVSNGPTRRTVEFGWFEGIDQTDIYDLSDEPDYVTPGTSAGVAFASAVRNDLPTMLDGLYVRLNGSERPVVYVPNVPYSESDTFQSTDGVSINGFVYGRTVGDIKVTTVLGTEQTSEVAQVAAIQIREEK